MAWANQSRRRQELPRNWHTIRARALHRDHYICQIRGQHCTRIATEVDHIGDRHNHQLANLRSACHTCHAARTHAQAQAAKPPRKRPTHKHPGLL